MKKMRLLTFMQLAETNPEMSFDTMQEELQISESEVESFIIDGILFFYNLYSIYIIYIFNLIYICIYINNIV
jgi:hypothetical protein